MGLLDKIYPDRFKIFKGYIFDKLIFNIYFLIFLAFAVLLAYSNWGNMDYYMCDIGGYNPSENPFLVPDSHFVNINGTMYCKNPFYTPATWKNEKYLVPASYGKDLTKPIGNLQLFAFLGLFGAVFLNHFIYNRKHKDFQ